jgi:hypothetical protein
MWYLYKFTCVSTTICHILTKTYICSNVIRDSSVGLATRFDFLQGQDTCLFSVVSRPILWTIQCPILFV